MNKKFKLLISIFVVFSLTFLVSCNTSKEANTNTSSNIKTEMKVHYIDVSQGDSELIQVNGKNMLIDSGPRSSEKDLINYLNNLNIKKLDYVIATHPHEDHIGNMDEVIKNFEIGEFYAPKVTTTTKTFEDMIKALKSKNLKINVLNENTNSIDLGKNTKVQVFSPKEDFKDKDLNNYSPIMKITYGKNSFLFTGDAETPVEEYVLSKGYNISSDVLKSGHHGSKTSSSEKFLQKVDPSVTIISCGTNNKYGHPNKETLEKLSKVKSKVYRTDKDGNIVLISNGTDIVKQK